jgi:hypothetical protein
LHLHRDQDLFFVLLLACHAAKAKLEAILLFDRVDGVGELKPALNPTVLQGWTLFVVVFLINVHCRELFEPTQLYRLGLHELLLFDLCSDNIFNVVFFCRDQRGHRLIASIRIIGQVDWGASDHREFFLWLL